MTRDLNLRTITGRLGRDPDLSNPGGQDNARLSVAVNTPVKQADGSYREATEWVTVIAWGKLASTASKYFSKGSKVFVTGRVEIRDYQKGDQTRQITELVASELQLLEPKRTETPTEESQDPFGDLEEEDIPEF